MTHMSDLMRCRRGATTIEYGIFLALAAMVLSSGIGTIGDHIGDPFSKAGAAMAATSPRTDGPEGGERTMLAASTNHHMIHIKEDQNGFLDRHGRAEQISRGSY